MKLPPRLGQGWRKGKEEQTGKKFDWNCHRKGKE